jgi:hypothetical protein
MRLNVHPRPLGDPRFFVLNHEFNPNRSSAQGDLRVGQRICPTEIGDQGFQVGRALHGLSGCDHPSRSQSPRGNEPASDEEFLAAARAYRPLRNLMRRWRCIDLTDPRECIPEYKADFGKDRSTKPIDWAFLHNGKFAFFVEAKEVGRRLAGFDEQLADYFAKDANVKLGILTNGAQWRFFTDVVNSNVMDSEPFAKWDIFADEPTPFDVITLMQKSSFNAELIRA